MSLSYLFGTPEGNRSLASIGHLRKHLTFESPPGVTWGHKPLVRPARPATYAYGSLMQSAWSHWLRLWLLQRHGATQEGELEVLGDLDMQGLFASVTRGGTGRLQRIRKAVAQAVARRRAVLLGTLEPAFKRQCSVWSEVCDDEREELSRLASAEVGRLAELYLEVPDRLGPKEHAICVDPGFGEWWRRFRRPGVNVVIGNTLWEISIATQMLFLQRDWAELGMFYRLSVEAQAQPPIRRVGLYFARFGTQVYIDTADLEAHADLDGVLAGIARALAAGRDTEPQRMLMSFLYGTPWPGDDLGPES